MVQLQEVEDADGNLATRLMLRNDSSMLLDRGWRLYFSLGLELADGEDRVRTERVDGRYGFLEPAVSWAPLESGESMEIPVQQWLFSGMNLLGKQGFHLAVLPAGNNEEVLLGSPTELPPLLQPISELRNAWMKQSSPSSDLAFQSPAHVFERNASAPADRVALIPEPKEWQHEGHEFSFKAICISGALDMPGELQLLSEMLQARGIPEQADGYPVRLSLQPALPESCYELKVNETGCDLVGHDAAAVCMGIQLLRQLIDDVETGWKLAKQQIKDWPDFSHRAFFLDIARHFQSPEQIKKIIRVMAAYRMNRLQLGISNDEGWRLEIPGIPELTEIGARRSYQAKDHSGSRVALYPAWGDNHEERWDFLTAAQFIDLLQYAKQLHIEIILEFNLPGHANALITALQTSGRYQVTDPADESRYRSAQGFSSNVVNVCQPDTYRFAGDVLKAFRSLYDQAGVAFASIHFGGDETPGGAWLDSPIVRSWEGWDPNWQRDNREDMMAARTALMHHHFRQLTSTAQEIQPGLRMGFWHEMSPYAEGDVLKHCYFNAWTTETGDRDIVENLLSLGEQMVISNASFLYFDMPYGLHAEEPGLPWAAYIDTRHIYEFDPIANWEIPPERIGQVLGLQAQLWAETVYSAELADYYIFPRLLALAERSWNRQPAASGWSAFAAALGQRELAYLDGWGVLYRVPAPGAIVEEGAVVANVAYPGLAIHYTLDGTDPGPASPCYEGPVRVTADQTINLVTVTGNGRCSRVVSLQ